MIESTDPYVYPGTDVLKNLRDILDFPVLAEFEAEATARRSAALRSSRITGKFDTPTSKPFTNTSSKMYIHGLANFVPSTSPRAAIPLPEPTSSIYL